MERHLTGSLPAADFGALNLPRPFPLKDILESRGYFDVKVRFYLCIDRIKRITFATTFAEFKYKTPHNQF